MTSPPDLAEALRRVLDGDTAAVRNHVRTLMVEHGVTAQHGLSPADHRELVRTWLAVLAEHRDRMGNALTGDPSPQDRLDTAAAFETLAHGDLSLLVKSGVQFGLYGGAIANLGTARHDRWLRAAEDLSLPGCFAMTERGHGSDVASLGTTATHDPDTDEFVITTVDPERDFKEWIGNAAEDARMAAVFAQLVVGGEAHGVHCLLVELRDADGNVNDGITITDCGHKMGLNGVDNGRIWFDHVRVPRTHLLNRFADVTADGAYTSSIPSDNARFFTTLGALVQGRVSIAGAGLGATKSALTIAVRHGLRRTQFHNPDGSPIRLMDYPTHQRRLLVPLAATYALHAAQVELVRDFAAAFDGDDPAARRQLESHAAALKVAATAHATATIQECREACGGLGYGTENRLAALKADTDVFTTFEGDNTVLAQLVGKHLLTGFAAEFNNMDWRGTAGFVASMVADTVVEATSVRTVMQRVRDLLDRESGPDAGLRNREWQLGMFAWRESHMLSALARRLRRATEPDTDEFAVFLACQNHMVATAHAHVERRVMEAFATMAAEADGSTRDVLEQLCDLHALATIERHRGWYQEHNRLSGERAKAVTAGVDQLCAEVAPHASDLVDAFAIPDPVLAAPIGRREPADLVAS